MQVFGAVKVHRTKLRTFRGMDRQHVNAMAALKRGILVNTVDANLVADVRRVKPLSQLSKRLLSAEYTNHLIFEGVQLNHDELQHALKLLVATRTFVHLRA